jgi:hypothetical protein
MQKVDSLYRAAVAAIQKYVAAKQRELDAAAYAARKLHDTTIRKEVVEGVTGPALPVARLLAARIVIGRADGYPSVTWPHDVTKVIDAARNAGILPGIMIGKIGVTTGCDGISVASSAKDADYEAWNAATEYRTRQTISSL